MAGLIEKDLRLIAKRKQTLYIFIALALFFTFSMDGSFIVGYFPFLGVIIFLSTITYDEMDNGYTFMMTLPIDRKMYVVEKYLLIMVSGAVVWAISIGLMFASNVIKHTAFDPLEEICGALMILAVILLVVDLLVPLQIKFGAEKSRLAMAAVAGVVVVIGLLLSNAFVLVGINIDEQINAAGNLPLAALIGIFYVAALIATIVSYRFSRLFMDQKQL